LPQAEFITAEDVKLYGWNRQRRRNPNKTSRIACFFGSEIIFVLFAAKPSEAGSTRKGGARERAGDVLLHKSTSEQSALCSDMVRVFLQHFFEKSSNINGFRAITKQYLHPKLNKF
jgi:hypothetical protein